MSRTRKMLVAAIASAVTAGWVLFSGLSPSAAEPPAPVILNSASPMHWLESDAVSDDLAAGNRTVTVSFVVSHPAGRAITGIVRDTDFDGTDETASLGVTALTSQTINGFTTSRVVHTFDPGRPGVFSCTFFGGGTRRAAVPLRFRVVDSTGERSPSVSADLHFVENDQCSGADDFPQMYAQHQNKFVAVPGESVTFTFRADDADVSGTNDAFDKYRWRWRRLNDGATSSMHTIDLPGENSDIQPTSQVVSFPSRGRYVVEAELGGESDPVNGPFQNGGNWFRLGAVDVNDSVASLSGSIAFSGSGIVAGPTPSVNAGSPVTAVATATDTDGVVQRIEWDDGGNGFFERTERTNALRSGHTVVQPPISGAQLQEPLDTSTFGVRTVVARLTDSGATDIVDRSGGSELVRSRTISAQLRINAVPTASGGSVTTNEDTPVTITLAGADADNQPQPLGFDLVAAMPASEGALGAVSGNTVTFTPAENFAGTTSFAFRTRDGGPGTPAAWATSNTATVTITVVDTNDPPTVDDASIVTDEDVVGSVQLTGHDDEDGTNLSYSLQGQPTHGTATCTPAGLCTYSPDDDFFGSDDFIVEGADSDGQTATATVSVTVDPVNDSPVAGDAAVDVPEDSVDTPITLSADDVDDTQLTFTAPIDDVDRGVLSCTGEACTYTPAPDYHGPDSFTFRVGDGSGASDVGTVAIDVTPVNDLPVAPDDSYTHYGSDTTLDVPTAHGVLSNDTDVEGDTLTTSLVSGPGHGLLVLETDGSFSYQPHEDFVGDDSFVYRASDGSDHSGPATVTIAVEAGCHGRAATTVGGSGSETLRGTPGADVIAGRGGDDRLLGGGGDDLLCGGAGNDQLNADEGGDHLDGGAGDDALRGDLDDDTLRGGAGADTLNAGGGDDTLEGGAGAPDVCRGDSGNDGLTASHDCERVSGVP